MSHPIRTLTSLRRHLQTAIEIEYATIPPYFTAWISANQDFNAEAAEVVRSVLLEEMLHLTLAANLLNAVGGKPSLTHVGFVPTYPHCLPHSGRTFEVSIERLSPAALDTFLKIERPEERDAKPEAGEYATIGQFYAAVADGFSFLCKDNGEQSVFCGNPALQIEPEEYYGSGSLVAVSDIKTALRAIEEIKEQGEGIGGSVFDDDRVILGPGDGQEPAHFFRFRELQLGRRYATGDTNKSGPTGLPVNIDFNSVYPTRANQRLDEFETDSEIRRRLEQFCKTYELLLAALESAFTGEKERLVESTARMFDLKNQALALVRTPIVPGSDTTVGLVFSR